MRDTTKPFKLSTFMQIIKHKMDSIMAPHKIAANPTRQELIDSDIETKQLESVHDIARAIQESETQAAYEIRCFYEWGLQYGIRPKVAHHVLDEYPEVILSLIKHGGLNCLCVDAKSFEKVTVQFATYIFALRRTARIYFDMNSAYEKANLICPEIAQRHSHFYEPNSSTSLKNAEKGGANE